MACKKLKVNAIYLCLKEKESNGLWMYQRIKVMQQNQCISWPHKLSHALIYIDNSPPQLKKVLLCFWWLWTGTQARVVQKVWRLHDWRASTFSDFCLFNSLRPSDAIWWQTSSSTVVLQVMACYLMAPSHFSNQCWFNINKLFLHSF